MSLRTTTPSGATPAARADEDDRGPTRWQDVATAGLALVVDLGLWGGDGTARWGGTVPVGTVVALGAACYSALVWRWRRPLTAFAVLWVYAVVCATVLPLYQSFAGLLVLVYHFARHLPVRRAAPVVAAVVVPFGLDVANTTTLNDAHLGEVVGVSAVWIGITASCWLVGRLGARAEQTASLREEHRVARAALAAQTERLRLARELHDSVASSITSVALQAAGARHRVRLASAAGVERGSAAATTDSTVEPDVGAALEAIETASTEAMRELRRLLGLLHSEDGAGEIGEGASLSDIGPLVTQARAVGVELEVQRVGGEVALDRSVDHAAYRVVQEAVTNIAKHAGAGARGRVLLTWRGSAVRVEVRNTRGNVAARPAVRARGDGDKQDRAHHLGLDGLRERVRSLGGSLGWEPQADGGFLLWAELPCVTGAEPT